MLSLRYSHKAMLCPLGIIGYLAVYFYYFPRRIHLRNLAGKTKRLQQIISACPSLWNTYFPTIWAPSTIQQMALGALRELSIGLGFIRSPYTHCETIELHDGQLLRLDWLIPSHSFQNPPLKQTSPVVVLNHGAFQSSSSVAMFEIARSCASKGFPVVVVNRRGYILPLTVPRYDMFGIDEDLDAVLCGPVYKRFPGHPIALCGFSCGAIIAARYVATRQRKYRDSQAPFPDILCGVALDYGFSVSDEGAVSKMNSPWREIIALLIWVQYYARQQFSLGTAAIRKEGDDSSFIWTYLSTIFRNFFLSDPTEPSVAVKATQYIRARSLIRRNNSHFVESVSHEYTRFYHNRDYNKWLVMAQPKLEDINVPFLLICSHDDPITRFVNASQFVDEENTASQRGQASPFQNVVLAELTRGAHGIKSGLLGWPFARDDMAPRIVAEFIAAVNAALQLEKRENPAILS